MLNQLLCNWVLLCHKSYLWRFESNPCDKHPWIGLIDIVASKWKKKRGGGEIAKLEHKWINIYLAVLQNIMLLILYLVYDWGFFFHIAALVLLWLLLLSPKDSFLNNTLWAITSGIWYMTNSLFWDKLSKASMVWNGKVEKQSLKNDLIEICFL